MHKSKSSTSTGPRTPEGKAKVSQNAVKHGLSASKVPTHFRQAYDAHREALLQAYKPANNAELDLFNQLAHSSFCLEQVRELELQYLSTGDDPMDNPKLHQLDRYRARHTREYNRALIALRTLQTDRIVLEQQAPLNQQAFQNTAPLAAFSNLTKQTDPLFRSDLTETVSNVLATAIREALDPPKVYMSVESPPLPPKREA